jgi:hypothetical protein
LSKTINSNTKKGTEDLNFKDITKKIGFKRKNDELPKIDNLPPDVFKASQPKKTKKAN